MLVLGLSALVAGDAAVANGESGAGPSVVPAAHTVRYEVTGSEGGAAAITYVSDGAGSVSRVTERQLPWTTDVGLRATGVPFLETAMRVVRDNGGVTGCRILVDGKVVAANRTVALGKPALVDCDAVVR